MAWSPAQGLSNPFVADPMATLTNDQRYILNVTTQEGCRASDTIFIRTFKGPAVYVPSAFTPNGDGRNEMLRPVYVGIRELRQFAVYNRWGQTVFATREMNRGWDGRGAPSGTYVWLVQAIDAGGNPMLLKGTVTIIR
jgi:gliding motility-associated-like protein